MLELGISPSVWRRGITIYSARTFRTRHDLIGNSD